MASLTFSTTLPPPIATPPGVGAIAAAVPVAAAAGQAGQMPLPLPVAQAAIVLAEPALDGAAPDGAAMRPDQVLIARQVAWPASDGAALAAAWRGLVQAHGTQLAARERQAQAGQLPAGLLATLHEPRQPHQPRAQDAGVPADPWRFTVHTRGPREQHLRVITGEPEQPPGRRRRSRAALRLELVMDDGAAVALQVEPTPAGLVIELCAPDPALLERLRALQPGLEEAVARAGLLVLRWRYHVGIAAGSAHARTPSADAAALLTLPVFRALAEMALQLPLAANAG
jgi:hypothetical protein